MSRISSRTSDFHKYGHRTPLKFSVFATAFVLSAHFVFADMTITEIFYDAPGSDKGSEWFEVYNSGGESVDLSAYRFAEGGVNHKLKSAQGGTVLVAGGYAVVVSDAETFKAGNPSFGGVIFESSFSLKNDGETISLKDGKLIVSDSVTYTALSGGDGDGDSLQKFPDGWKPSRPSPGGANIFAPRSAPTPPVSVDKAGATGRTSVSVVNEDKSAGNSQTAVADDGNGLLKWGVVLGGALLAGALSYAFSPRQSKSEADEFKITE